MWVQKQGKGCYLRLKRLITNPFERTISGGLFLLFLSAFSQQQT